MVGGSFRLNLNISQYGNMVEVFLHCTFPNTNWLLDSQRTGNNDIAIIAVNLYRIGYVLVDFVKLYSGE